jgi:hypothetical protein
MMFSSLALIDSDFTIIFVIGVDLHGIFAGRFMALSKDSFMISGTFLMDIHRKIHRSYKKKFYVVLSLIF